MTHENKRRARNQSIRKTDCAFPFGRHGASRSFFSKIASYCVLPLLLFATWYLLANAINKPYLFPTPGNTFKLFLHPGKSLLSQGSLWKNTIVSLLRIIAGFSLSVLVAVPLGVLIGGFAPFRRFCEPVIEILRPVCPIAWIPFAIAVFKITTLPEFLGLGYTHTIFDHLQLGMIFVIFWGAFFPILINTLDGVAGVRRDYIKLARMLGAGKLQLLTKVAIPAAFPMIITGLRQGVGLSWFVIIAAEMLPGSEIGIGYLLMYAADQSAMNIVLASIIVIGAIGASFNFFMIFISRKFILWHGEEI